MWWAQPSKGRRQVRFIWGFHRGHKVTRGGVFDCQPSRLEFLVCGLFVKELFQVGAFPITTWIAFARTVRYTCAEAFCILWRLHCHIQFRSTGQPGCCHVHQCAGRRAGRATSRTQEYSLQAPSWPFPPFQIAKVDAWLGLWFQLCVRHWRRTRMKRAFTWSAALSNQCCWGSN